MYAYVPTRVVGRVHHRSGEYCVNSPFGVVLASAQREDEEAAGPVGAGGFKLRRKRSID